MARHYSIRHKSLDAIVDIREFTLKVTTCFLPLRAKNPRALAYSPCSLGLILATFATKLEQSNLPDN